MALLISNELVAKRYQLYDVRAVVAIGTTILIFDARKSYLLFSITETNLMKRDQT
jgi:hypothetical protein